MKLTIVILFAVLFLSAYADISISHTNADDQSVLLEFKAPTADPSGKVLRVEITATTQYLFGLYYTMGALCTIATPEGKFPRDAVSNVFVISLTWGENSGCVPGDFYETSLYSGTVDGKSFFLKNFSKSSISQVFLK